MSRSRPPSDSVVVLCRASAGGPVITVVSPKARVLMNTYFIRHNTGMDIDDDTRQRLWEEYRIAIHFPWDRTGKKTNGQFEYRPRRLRWFRETLHESAG